MAGLWDMGGGETAGFWGFWGEQGCTGGTGAVDSGRGVSIGVDGVVNDVAGV